MNQLHMRTALEPKGDIGANRRKAKKDKNMQPTASTHTHGTRANVKKHQQGAQPTANTAMHQIDSEVHHATLHSNAINPDTGRTSEYLELSKCSDGHHWIEACANEIGCLCHGCGADSTMTSGTNTMFFIPSRTHAQRPPCNLHSNCLC
jgi:hypothetical protein